MLSLNSWMKGKAWAQALPANVKDIRFVYMPGKRMKVFGEVMNSRGKYQPVQAVVSYDYEKLWDCDGGTVLEDGSRFPFTYHVAALLWAAKVGRAKS